ncbi:hypothetical protein P3G55_11295 [Leptospira sp. 96542]|nr:hypothetical protein [Leptospira sp. 96542]
MSLFSKIFALFLLMVTNTKNFANGDLQTAFGAEENYLLIQSIDASVIHLGTDAEKTMYKDNIDLYLEFKSYHIQGQFSNSYYAMRKTQFSLITLYDQILEKNIEYLKDKIQSLGQKSRGKEKAQTKAFLRLALRDLAEAEIKLKMARNTRPYLYLLKLREMLFALKILKHAGKFVIFLNLLHDGQYLDSIESTDFIYIEYEIKRGFGDNSEKLLKLHYDNHFLPYGEVSIYESKMTEFKFNRQNKD